MVSRGKATEHRVGGFDFLTIFWGEDMDRWAGRDPSVRECGAKTL